MFIIDSNKKSVLAKEKVYCPDVGKLEFRYFVYSIEFKLSKVTGKTVPKFVNLDECKNWGIKSLRKAKALHLLNSI